MLALSSDLSVNILMGYGLVATAYSFWYSRKHNFDHAEFLGSRCSVLMLGVVPVLIVLTWAEKTFNW